jgi:hypothetical protein
MTWDDAVLDVLGRRPRRTWMLQDIYVEIGRFPIVTAHHRETWGSQPNFHHWVRSALNRLKHSGHVEHVGRSAWRFKSP